MFYTGREFQRDKINIDSLLQNWIILANIVQGCTGKLWDLLLMGRLVFARHIPLEKRGQRMLMKT
jgi:hypothetical protein